MKIFKYNLKLYLIILCSFQPLFCLSQNFNPKQTKPLIDTGTLNRWPKISGGEGNVALSRNGQYAAYVVTSQPIGQNTLVMQDLLSNWKKSIISKNPRIVFFSADSRRLFWKQGDSLWLHTMGNDQSQLLSVNSAPDYPKDALGRWLVLPSDKQDGILRLANLITGDERLFSSVKNHIWLKGGNKLLLNNSMGGLRLINLTTKKEQSFTSVGEYALSPDENNILIATKSVDNLINLQCVQLDKGERVTIWKGRYNEQPSNYVFDKKGDQLAFQVRQSNNSIAIWHYKLGHSSALLKIDNKTVGIQRNLPISGIRGFSGNGRWLFFNVREQMSFLRKEIVTAPVDIWSYRDEILNPTQSRSLPDFHDYAAVVEINSNKIQVLEQAKDEIVNYTSPGDYLILTKGVLNISGNWWPHLPGSSTWLLCLNDGKRSLIKKHDKTSIDCNYSPGGHLIYYWDPKLGHYFRVDTNTGKTINMTDKLPVSLIDDGENLIDLSPVGIAGWSARDSALLIYDNYDIWKVDPTGQRAPINITGGYGRKNNIKLRLVDEGNQYYIGNEKLLLTGLGVETLQNGFFSIKLDRPGVLEELINGPYVYYQVASQQGFGMSFNNGMKPLNAGNGKDKHWLLMRQSATEYPNLYVSKDLKKLTPLTNLQPQKNYNWLTAVPVTWTMYNGKQSHGVLYKPENFDPAKKYPVIFNYYEKFSHRCFQFPMPELITSSINIPWFVSRGYLVFTPDIHYTADDIPGGMTAAEAAYNSVASAAEFLSLQPYVDKSRMAIQGHSFGGFETNNIITKTNMFAAAAEMGGTSDALTSYLTLYGVPSANKHKMDHPQGRRGSTPWQRPDLYVRSSPVLNADKVTTPLFIVHNKADNSINFEQGVEMYMALRRLGKVCWLLQYDNSAHTLRNEKDALDYTIRLTQYFDHYLKGKPATQWMTMNTLAQYKGKNNLYELDPKGNCGKDCNVCKEWNSKTTTNLKKNEEYH